LGRPPVTHNRLRQDDLWWPLLYCFTVLFDVQLFNDTLTSDFRRFQ
jgi:hypothetical protein